MKKTIFTIAAILAGLTSCKDSHLLPDVPDTPSGMVIATHHTQDREEEISTRVGLSGTYGEAVNFKSTDVLRVLSTGASAGPFTAAAPLPFTLVSGAGAKTAGFSGSSLTTGQYYTALHPGTYLYTTATIPGNQGNVAYPTASSQYVSITLPRTQTFEANNRHVEDLMTYISTPVQASSPTTQFTLNTPNTILLFDVTGTETYTYVPAGVGIQSISVRENVSADGIFARRFRLNSSGAYVSTGSLSSDFTNTVTLEFQNSYPRSGDVGRLVTYCVQGNFPATFPRTDGFTISIEYSDDSYSEFNKDMNKAWVANKVYTINLEVDEAPNVIRSGRITWKNGRYELTNDCKDAGLYFKFGSVVGLFTGRGERAGMVEVLPLNDNNFMIPVAFTLNDIAWHPLASIAAWANIPYNSATTSDEIPHSAAEVKAGRGDPCRLVGLNLDLIRAKAIHDELDDSEVDNGRWRLPTDADNKGYFESAANFIWGSKAIGHINNLSPFGPQVVGGEFPTRGPGIGMGVVDRARLEKFLPSVGFRDEDDGGMYFVGNNGYYWSSTASGTGIGVCANFTSAGVMYESQLRGRRYGVNVRCVRQDRRSMIPSFPNQWD